MHVHISKSSGTIYDLESLTHILFTEGVGVGVASGGRILSALPLIYTSWCIQLDNKQKAVALGNVGSSVVDPRWTTMSCQALVDKTQAKSN